MKIEGHDISLTYTRGFFDVKCDSMSYGEDVSKLIEEITGVDVCIYENGGIVFKTKVMLPYSTSPDEAPSFRMKEWFPANLPVDQEGLVHIPNLLEVSNAEEGREFLTHLKDFIHLVLEAKQDFLSTWTVS
jgi:hypothetical protein